MRSFILLSLGLLGAAIAGGAHAALGPNQLALVVNDNEPNSVTLSALYREAHQVPEKNIIHVRLDPRARKLSPEDFAPLRQQILGQLGPEIRAEVMALQPTA